MRKPLLTLAVASALAAPTLANAQAAAAPASPHTISGNVSLVSDYRFRGITQTFEKPALQGGIDYSHASGLYLGNWNSNISEGAGFPQGNLEMDFYGGWKKSFGDFGLDIGAIYYMYPGTDANTARGTNFTNPSDATKTHTGKIDNKEIYVGGSWKWLSAKWFHALGDYFSLPGTKGTNYLDLAANYDLGGGWGLVGHYGKLKSKGWSVGTDATKMDYSDWKIGVTKDIGGWLFGASYIDTDAAGSCNPANVGFYCFGNDLPNTGPGTAGVKFKDAGSSTIVFSVSKTF
jgi:uncharacterized protein (TIGR02001 family)